ncbi:uncharacterized protein [Argopecten irradians]|uniref:uncharacterized protein n=1 Tax=Argopecten irradians TaxID=31199 RepID=UPI00371CA71F
MVRRAPLSVQLQLVICVLSVYTKGDSESSCSRMLETIPHARMCTDDVINSELILVTTRDAYTSGHVTCTCTASLSSPGNITVERFSDEISSANESCDEISPKSRWNDTSAILPCQNNTTVEIELSPFRVLDIEWNDTSDNTNNTHCVLLNSTVSGNITVTCVTQMTTESVSSALNNNSVTIHATNFTTTVPMTSDSEMPRNSTTSHEENTGLIIIVSAPVVGSIILVVIITVTIAICKRRSSQQPKTTVPNSPVSTASGASYIDSTLDRSVSLPRPYSTYGTQLTSNNKIDVN